MRTTWRGSIVAGPVVVSMVLSAVVAAAACGDDADVAAAGGGGGLDATTGVDGSADAGGGGNDAGGSDALGSHDVSGDVIEVLGDGGVCVLPANTCEDAYHLRVRSNLRADAGADGGECAWDEQVVDCTQLGGDSCIGGQCTAVIR